MADEDAGRDATRPHIRSDREGTRLARIVLVLLLFLGVGAPPARAHVGGSTGLATVEVSGHTIRYRLQLPLSALPPGLTEAMRLGDPTRTPDYRPLADLVARRVHLYSGAAACEPVPGTVTAPPNDIGDAIVVVHYACAKAPGTLTIEDDLYVELGKDHHTIASVVYPGGSRQFVFQPDARLQRVEVSGAQPDARPTGFFALGIEHILTGYDHLLFLLALILAGGNLWSLLKIVTAFTLAHSITLALAVLDVVVLPARLVEATIAASIAYVAAENLFARKPSSHRWAVSFVFGLVHGFGFSSVLRELSLPQGGLVWSLVGFNLGVEFGQAMVVAATIPVLMWMRRSKWEPRAVAAVSAGIFVVGMALFVERGFFA